ncbi:helix-turn-helix transcriptional regulator [Dyella aluminiiresistens]|uniref:helix-turn-helix transcriptional regulator n=1 Tax=Dyella aluminiiresistens TaxID=3069105 RepID=UPI00399CD16C
MAARSLGCSLSTLHKTCAKHGVTFNQLLMETRLSVAAAMLGRSSDRISEIAYACGFTSLPHFCRQFKARYKVSPRQMRDWYVVKKEGKSKDQVLTCLELMLR